MMRLALILVTLLMWLPMSASYVTPPSGHPRLYLREGDIPALKEKLASEQGRMILKRMEAMAEPRPSEEEIPYAERDFRYYFEMRGLSSKVELLALDYLTEGNESSARVAIEMMLDSLKKTDFPKERDLSRASGVMLMVGAVVYDWCYDQLSEDEKADFIREFRRIASTMECGYPISVVETMAGHTCEWMIMRDMLSAGVAVYDEYPDMYDDAMRVITENFVPVRDFCYQSGNYHQGSKYLPTRYSAELFAQWIIARMGGGNLFCEEQKSLLYDVIYRMRPDGMPLPAGDENPSAKPRDENFALPAMLASSYYKDPHIRNLYEKNTDVIAHSLFFDLLWNDCSLASAPDSTLPLTRFCPYPFGWLIARTGWGEDCVIAEMKINNQFVGNHQHLDGGSFQIYHKGALAIDSGIYEGTAGGYGSEHCRDYSKRTIAHNSLLIYDPQEKFAWYKARPQKGKPARYAANDGGQRMPGPKGWDTAADMDAMLSDEYTVGKTLSYSGNADWSYLRGDITAAYSEKVESVVRSFVFCDMHDRDVPAVLVVYDQVVSSDPSFRKIFLLHSIEKPEMDGRSSYYIKRTAPGQDGLLHCSVLLPRKTAITLVGGPGHEFEVFGKNYPNSVDGDPDVEAGAWRVEVSPVAESASDEILNVIEVSHGDCFRKVKVRRVSSEGYNGADFRGRMVIFAKEASEYELKVPGDGREVLICGIEAGNWCVKQKGGSATSYVVEQGKNTLSFKARKGVYRISRQ